MRRFAAVIFRRRWGGRYAPRSPSTRKLLDQPRPPTARGQKPATKRKLCTRQWFCRASYSDFLFVPLNADCYQKEKRVVGKMTKSDINIDRNRHAQMERHAGGVSVSVRSVRPVLMYIRARGHDVNGFLEREGV